MILAIQVPVIYIHHSVRDEWWWDMVVATSRPEVAPARAGLRRLLWGRGVSALGDGLWFTIWALYFTRVLHLSAASVGVTMALAGGAGLAAAVPLGALADRFGPRGVLLAITLVRACAMAAYLLVHGMWAFLLITIAFTAPANGATAVRTALVAGLVTGDDVRVRALSWQRVVQHAGYALGAALGAVVLAADRPGVYLVAIAANASTFFVLAVLTAAVPAPPPVRTGASGTEGIRLVLRDRPYLAVMAATSVLSLCWAMLSTGLPLWLSRSTELPLSLSGAVVVISSVGIAVFQVPASHLARTVGQAARTAAYAGTALAVSCVILSATHGGAGTTAAAAVILAALFHVIGELGFVAAGWGLSITLMREHARGAYQGASEAGTATAQMFGPAVFTFALTACGAAGWLLVAVVFLGGGASVPGLARWAESTRHHFDTPPDQLE
jgi:MFS family permease